MMSERTKGDSSKGERNWAGRERSSPDSARGERMKRWLERADSPQGERRSKDTPIVIARARVWMMKDGKPVAVSIMRGLMNTQYVELVDGELNEGAEVIIGTIGGQTATASSAQNNPFQPRMPGGGGGGGRRGM
jgi:hypothetical protein